MMFSLQQGIKDSASLNNAKKVNRLVIWWNRRASHGQLWQVIWLEVMIRETSKMLDNFLVSGSYVETNSLYKRCQRQHSKGARSFQGQKSSSLVSRSQRLSQDFLWGCTFPLKSWPPFLVTGLKTQATNATATDCTIGKYAVWMYTNHSSSWNKGVW